MEMWKETMNRKAKQCRIRKPVIFYLSLTTDGLASACRASMWKS